MMVVEIQYQQLAARDGNVIDDDQTTDTGHVSIPSHTFEDGLIPYICERSCHYLGPLL